MPQDTSIEFDRDLLKLVYPSTVEKLISARTNDTPQKLKPQKFVFFWNEKGESLHFILQLKESEMIEKYTSLIEEHYGTVHTRLKDFGSHSIMLVPDNSFRKEHDGDCFKVTYIDSCIETGRILDLNDFIRFRTNKFVNHLDFMKIVYYHEFTWDTVPSEYLTKKDDFVEPDKKTFIRPENSRNRYVNKNTRYTYSDKERKDMIQYIVSHRDYDRIKGNMMWKEMEKEGVCPIRTWQSMKEHFLKRISREILSNRCYYLEPSTVRKFARVLQK